MRTYKMRALRGLFASFVAFAAFPIIALIFLGVTIGYEKSKNYINRTYDNVVRDYGLFGSPVDYIKDDERREREIQKKIEEYNMVLANTKRSSTSEMTDEEALAMSTADANEAANDEGLKGYPEYEKELQAKIEENAKNPPLSPVQQAMKFLTSSRQTVQDGINHNQLNQADMAAISSAMLSGDISRLQDLEKIYSRKEMVVYDEKGNSQRLIQTNDGPEILKLDKAETQKYEARMME